MDSPVPCSFVSGLHHAHQQNPSHPGTAGPWDKCPGTGEEIQSDEGICLFFPTVSFFFFFQEKTIIMTPIGPCPLFPFFLFTKAAGGWKWLGAQWLLLPRVCGCARLDPAPWHCQQSPGCAQGMGSPPALRLGTTSGNKQQQHQDIFPSHRNAYIDEKK